jgi:tetratricopeptide (TPR) repeat protein
MPPPYKRPHSRPFLFFWPYEYLLRAGHGATARYANQEAINHLDRALRLIGGLAEGPERTALELQALTMVGAPRIALHGYASKEVEATYRRTVELAERTGDTPQLFQGLRGLWNCIYDRADLENAREIAERLCALAIDHPAPEASALAYRAVGATLFSLGRFGEAIQAFEKCVEACNALPAEAGVREHGESPLIIGGAYAGWANLMAGNFDRGMGYLEEALAAARRLKNPLAFAFAYHLAADAEYHLGNAAECACYSDESAGIADEHRLVFWTAAGDVMGGWAAARLGGDTGDIERIRRGIHAWQTSGAELHIPTFESQLADGLLAIGSIDEADETIDHALALARSRSEMFAVSVLLRLKGRAADIRGDPQAAERHFASAMAMAREQGAYLSALRAACELARLVVRRGDRSAARLILDEVFEEIRGGESQACVIAARELLDSLA